MDVRDYKQIDFYHDLTGHIGSLYPTPNYGEGEWTYYYHEAEPTWYMTISFQEANERFNNPKSSDKWIFIKGERT